MFADRDGKQEQSAAVAQMNTKKLKDYQNQVFGLYFKTLEELLVMDTKAVHGELDEIFDKDNFHASVVAVCIETIFFVNNSSSVKFTTLLKLCEIQAFDFWRVISSFIKSDPHMPFPLKKHLHNLDIKIVTQLAWVRGSSVHQLVQHFFQDRLKNGTSPSSNHCLTSSDIAPTIKNSTETSSNSTDPMQPTTMDKTDETSAKLELTNSQEVPTLPPLEPLTPQSLGVLQTGAPPCCRGDLPTQRAAQDTR